jgi:pimeloyl-ACP methyl ester carboxylesterase
MPRNPVPTNLEFVPIWSEYEAGTARIAYQVSGDGPPLVLLHGLSGSARWWARNAPVFSRRFRVYAIDLVGFGLSRGQPFSLGEAPGLLLRWMDSLPKERFHLAGHSMGGLVAASLAAFTPQRVDRLVLVDALALPIGHSLARSALGLLEAARYTPFDFLPVLAGDALRAGPLTLLRAVREVHRAGPAVDLARIAAQTLVVWGEHDTILPLRYGQALFQELHRTQDAASFSVIPGAGHMPMWDHPAEFNRLVLGFLDGDGDPLP